MVGDIISFRWAAWTGISRAWRSAKLGHWDRRLNATQSGNFKPLVFGEIHAAGNTGGSTPRSLYERLAEPAVASRFPWSRVHWFWGDERFVPHDDPDSNYRMACEALLSQVRVDSGNIHAVPTENLSPDQAAAAYEGMLKRFYGADTLEFAASYLRCDLARHRRRWTHGFMFPGQPALEEDRRWALAIVGARPETRITLTYPVLNSSRDVAFLATGEGKREVVARAGRIGRCRRRGFILSGACTGLSIALPLRDDIALDNRGSLQPPDFSTCPPNS